MTRPLTVGELRALLAHFPNNLPVVFAYPSGDEQRHDLAGAVTTAFVARTIHDPEHDLPRLLEDYEAGLSGKEVLALSPRG